MGIAGAALGATQEPPRGKRMNVVLAVSDDHGFQLGCYGDATAQTPHLDALAADGTLFTHAFCTSASCSASRSVILTGLHNHANGQFGHQHGFHNFHTHRWVRSLPVLLAAAGYRTCSIGKFHVQPEETYRFEFYENEGIPGGSRNPVAMAENAKRFIERPDPRPFFLYFCTSDPHRAGKGFANERDYPGCKPLAFEPAKVPVPSWLPDYPETRAELADYYASIHRLDQGMGRLAEVLKQTGHWDDTVVVYLSDNGPPWPGAKTTLYEPGMHLPLIVRHPGQARRGIACNAMVSWADIAPTILDIAGAKGPDYPLHGRSFLSVLSEKSPEGWDEVHASHTFHEITMYYPIRAIRTRRWKYLLNLAHQLPFPFASDLYESRTWQALVKRGDKMFGKRTADAYLHRPRHELYDLEADPHEAVNLAEAPEQAAVLAGLQKKLREWQERTKDPWVVKYRYE